MPGLSADFADGVIIVAHLIEEKCMDLAAVDLAFFVKHLFIRFNVYDLTQDAQTVGLLLHLHDPAFERNGIFRDDRRVHKLALFGMQRGAGEFVRNLVAADKTEIVRFHQGVLPRDRQREGAAPAQVYFIGIDFLRHKSYHAIARRTSTDIIVMGFYDNKGKYRLESGLFRIFAGGSSRAVLEREIRLSF